MLKMEKYNVKHNANISWISSCTSSENNFYGKAVYDKLTLGTATSDMQGSGPIFISCY